MPGYPLDDGDGTVTDTIDREEHGIGVRDTSLKQATAVFDAAIVVNEFGTRLLCEALKLRD